MQSYRYIFHSGFINVLIACQIRNLNIPLLKFLNVVGHIQMEKEREKAIFRFHIRHFTMIIIIIAYWKLIFVFSMNKKEYFWLNLFVIHVKRKNIGLKYLLVLNDSNHYHFYKFVKVQLHKITDNFIFDRKLISLFYLMVNTFLIAYVRSGLMFV